MSDCLHCDIHDMLESHLQSEQADLAEIAAKITEVLADLMGTGTQYVAATSGNVSRLLWGEAGVPSVVVYRDGGSAAGTASESRAAQSAAALRGARMSDTDPGRGGRIFSVNCSACHGAAGEGMTGPSLKAIGRRLSPQELSAWIMNPVAARDAANGLVMPRLYPSALTEQDVFDVAAFVGTL